MEMKTRKILSFCLAASFVAGMFALPMGASAEGETAEPKEVKVSVDDTWKAEAADNSIVALSDEKAALGVENTADGGLKFTVKALPDSFNAAEGAKKWLNVFVKVSVDLDKYPILVWDAAAGNKETGDLFGQMKVSNDVDELYGQGFKDYILMTPAKSSGETVANVQNVAEENKDDTKTGEGEESFWMSIAIFPNKVGDTYTINSLSFVTTDEYAGWQADFSADGLKNWATINKDDPGVVTNLADANAMLKATPKGDTGVTLQFANKIENHPYASITNNVTVDVSKAPKMFLDLEGVKTGSAGVNVKLEYNGKILLLNKDEIKEDGKIEFDLSKPLTVEKEGKPSDETVQLSSVVTFKLNIYMVCYAAANAQALSSMTINDLYMAAEAKKDEGGNEGGDEGGEGGETNPPTQPTEPEITRWFADVSDLSKWMGTGSKGDTNEVPWLPGNDEKVIVKAVANGQYGMKLNLQKDKMNEKDDPWQFLTQEITLDLDKTPYLFFKLSSLQSGDAIGVKVEGGTKGIGQTSVFGDKNEINAAGVYKIDLREILGTGEQTFKLHFVPVDSNKDGSEFVIDYAYISDKDVTNPTTGDAAPIAAVAVLAVSGLAVLLSVKKRRG